MTKPKRLRNRRLTVLKRGGLLAGLTLTLMLCGCGVSSQPSPGRAPQPLDIHVDYSSGTTLSGPGPMDMNSLRIGESFSVSLQLFALENVPPQALESIQKHVRLVMMSPRVNFLSPIMRLTPGVRVAFADVNESTVESLTSGLWGPAVPAGNVTSILPPNVTARIDLKSTQEASIRGNHLRLLLARRPDPDPNHPGALGENLEMAVVRSGQVPPAEELGFSMIDAPQAEDEELETATQRVALLPIPLTSPYRCLLLVPFAWDSPWAGAMGLYVKLERLPERLSDPRQLESFAQCVDDLMRQAESMTAGPRKESNWAGCLLALEQLVWRSHWRRALVDLTHTAQAALARDMALGAPVDVAQGLAGAIYAAQIETPAETMPGLTWLLEKTAYGMLLEMSEQDELIPALATYLLRHAGQLGRQQATLREQLTEARDLSDLEWRLIRENRIALEDMSPAARSRAYRWLARRDEAPAGYDPLASMQERRAALQAALDQKGGTVD